MNKDFQIGPNAFYEYSCRDVEAYYAINELANTMNNTKITSQNNGEAAVRARQYIVGSISQTGEISFAANPTIQFTATQARTECKRLASMNPGKTFIYVQFQGAERTVVQPTSVSI